MLVRVLISITARLLWHIRIEGKSNIPATGAFLLCPVHRSNVDGPLTAIFTKRQMRYFAKSEMFKPKAFARLISSMGAIPVNRGNPDRQALKACLDVLADGWGLVLFPEGGRKSGPVVEEVQEGAVYLATRANVPVVPVGIDGSDAANPKGTGRLKSSRIRVVIGEPMTFGQTGDGARVSRNSIREGTEELRQRLAELSDRAASTSK